MAAIRDVETVIDDDVTYVYERHLELELDAEGVVREARFRVDTTIRPDSIAALSRLVG